MKKFEVDSLFIDENERWDYKTNDFASYVIGLTDNLFEQETGDSLITEGHIVFVSLFGLANKSSATEIILIDVQFIREDIDYLFEEDPEEWLEYIHENIEIQTLAIPNHLTFYLESEYLQLVILSQKEYFKADFEIIIDQSEIDKRKLLITAKSHIYP